MSLIGDWNTSGHTDTYVIIIYENVRKTAKEVNKERREERALKKREGETGEEWERKKRERYSELTLQPEVAGQGW